MVADLGTIVKVEVSTDSINSAIDLCDDSEIFGDLGSILFNLKTDIELAAEDGLKTLAENNKSYQEDFISSNGSIVTGGLINSIMVDETSDKEYYIGTFLDYAYYVEYGRGPVVPVTAKVLHFEIDGEDIFTHYSGPAEPRPFVAPAFEKTESEAISVIEEAINNVIN